MLNNLVVIFALSILLFVVPSAHARERRNLIETLDFETGDLSQVRNANALSGAVAQSPTRHGKYALKVTRQAGSDRSEIAAKRADTGREYWYGWSIYLPSEYRSNDSRGEIVTQLHKYQPNMWNAGPANFALRANAKDGRWVLQHNYQINYPAREVKQTSNPLGALVKGKWTDFVVHAKWSYRDDGFLYMWMNGKLVYSRQGSIYFDFPLGPYFKIGMYKGDESKSHVMYADEYRLGTADATCADVAPSNSSSACGTGDVSPARASTPSVEKVTVGSDTYQVEWLHYDSFESADWWKNWVSEGPSKVSVVDGRLLVTKPSGSGGEATIWLRQQLPANLIVRYKAKALESDTNNKCNLNQFTHTTETDGSPIKFGLRNGNYEEYHRIPNYIVTFTFDHSRVRRDPGFNQLSETRDQAQTGVEYAITVVVKEGHLRYYINGRRVHDVLDPKPLPAGHFAIRTWNTTAWWDDFDFGRVW